MAATTTKPTPKAPITPKSPPTTDFPTKPAIPSNPPKSSRPKINCPVCNRLLDKLNLRIHMYAKHHDGQAFKRFRIPCSLCCKNFGNVRQLAGHLRARHAMEKRESDKIAAEQELKRYPPAQTQMQTTWEMGKAKSAEELKVKIKQEVWE